MKRLTILLMLFGLTFTLQSQIYYCYAPSSPDDLRHYLKYQQKDRDSILENKISHVISYNKLYNGKKGQLKRSVLASEHVYDNRGDLVNYSEYNNKGKLRFTVSYTYAENGMRTGMKMYDRDGKFIRGWKATLNNTGMVERCKYYRKKEDRLAWAYTCEYNADTLKVKELQFNSKGRQDYLVERDYYPNRELKETRTYKKGKLKRVIKYDCTPIGETADKSKTSAICMKTSYDADSNRVETKEVTHKGKIWRNVWKYNKLGQMTEFTSIDHKGQQQYRYNYTFNDMGKVSGRSYFRKNRLMHTYAYEYAPGGQLALTRYLDKKNRMWWEQFEVIN